MSGSSTMTVDSPLRIMFICTANRCRSPLAEVIARSQLDRRSILAHVASAGYLESGHEAASGSINAAKKMGLDLRSHLSRQLDPEMITDADLIIGMQPDHILDLTEMVPGAPRWALTLKELARASEPTGSASGPLEVPAKPMSNDDLRGWIRSAGSRSLSSLMSGDNTVVDPIGRSDRAFRSTAKEIEALISTVFDFWFGPE